MKQALFFLLFGTMLLSAGVALGQGQFKRPQTPVPPFPYQNLEVVYDNPSDTGVHLAATLTLPPGEGPFPAVLLIGGSGQFARDEPFYGHRPFLVLADYLTRRGIATLRFDDRGAGKSTLGSKSIRELTQVELMSDAVAGIRFLQGHPAIDKKRIGALGGSAGASQAATLAVQMPGEIAFVIHMVGTSNLTPGEIVALQSKTVSRIQNHSSIAQEADSNFVKRSLWFTKNEPDMAKREAAIQKIAEEELAKIPEVERSSVSFASRVKILSSEYFYKGANSPVRDILKEVQTPILVINGGKDVLVDGYYNVPRIKASLEAGGNKDFEIHLLEDMNHRMQKATTGLMEESKDIEESIMPEVLQLIGDWLWRHGIRS